MVHSTATFLIEFGAIILGLGLLGRFAGRFRIGFRPVHRVYFLRGCEHALRQLQLCPGCPTAGQQHQQQ